ncbi:MAG TPA: hypothetical protein VFS33_08130 [Gemmatimonadales bacterium]|nr:hypothetical protein [Gemmatimonadales bacterium]
MHDRSARRAGTARPLRALGALARWRQEVHARRRDPAAWDALQAAAANELAALEHAQAGRLDVARQFMSRAILRLYDCPENPGHPTADALLARLHTQARSA